MESSAERSTTAPDPSTNLALERTHAANERTLMAWIRTGISLITFGFTVYKFFDLEMRGPQSASWIGPRGFGTAMILIGLVSLVLGIVSHKRAQISLDQGNPKPRHSLAMLVAGLVTILGLFGLAMTIFQH